MFQPLAIGLALFPLGPGANELAQLTGSTTAAGDKFGQSVDLDGDTIVVGAYQNDNAGGNDAGAAYVFERAPGVKGPWVEVALLTGSHASPVDQFGRAVAIDGDTIVVGAPRDANTDGAVYVFERNLGGPNAWGQAARLLASNGTSNDRLGMAVAIEGDTIVAGAPWDNFSGFRMGSAYIFERDLGGPGAWGEAAFLLTSSVQTGAQANFGNAVAVEGDIAIVAAPEDEFTGVVSVFQRDAGGSGLWSEVERLVGSDTEDSDSFGSSVALEGGTLAVGAKDAIKGTTTFVGPGAAYVFERNYGGEHTFVEVAQLTAPDGVVGDRFGIGVGVSGDAIAVGADLQGHGGLVPTGAAYWFERDEGGTGTWGLSEKLSAAGGEAGDRFGTSVAVQGSIALIGAYRAEHAAGKGGSAYVFGLGVLAENYCTAGTSASGCSALISSDGTPSASASSGFDLIIGGVEGSRDGLFFYGTMGRQANPWGNSTSYVCVVPPRWRGGLLAGVGNPGACDGSFRQDLNARWCPTCPKPAHNPGAGAVVQAQMWYRDPQNTSYVTSSMSDAIEFCVGP